MTEKNQQAEGATGPVTVAASHIADAARALGEHVAQLRASSSAEADDTNRTLASLLVSIGLESLLRGYRTATPMSPEQFAEHWAIRERRGALRPRRPTPAPPLPGGLPDIPGWSRVSHERTSQGNEAKKLYRPPMPGSNQ